MRVLGIIPSRLESSRLPQKPLKEILGIPLILHVARRASFSNKLTDLIVATDSEKIAKVVRSDGHKAIITSSDCLNGTERLAEVANVMPDYDYYCLINGDEILLNPKSIAKSLNTLLGNKAASASMLAVKYSVTNSTSDFKIVLNCNNEVIYISRNDIPSAARNPVPFMLKAYHLMTFTKACLDKYMVFKPSYLELTEGHEHLRLIENCVKISCSIVNDTCISLDTPSDVPIIEKMLQEDKYFEIYR